jgi:quercetin dioxygenase-like cupin family protein
MVEHGHDQHDGRPHGHESHETAEIVDLTALADALLADLVNHPAGRTAKTIISGTVMRAVVIALAEGSEMSEHDAPPAATLHVIKGLVHLRVGEQEQPVRAGELVPIPRRRHAVSAHADSAFLLTVALR